jgi:two-component system sensor histidine kinase LytS
MRQGLTFESAQEVCNLILPATHATAVAITNREIIMGFTGTESDTHPIGGPIMSHATHAVLRDAQMRVLRTPAEIGFPDDYETLRSAIVVPLMLQDASEPAGALKLYYTDPDLIDETQRAMAEGLASLLAMQLSLAELDAQREAATRMRLKALQAQINPHFLFNTINTIAALIRTDPARARVLLREFATFYRQTLEGSMDLITLDTEYMQTLRYFGFQVARFGEERVHLDADIGRDIADVLVPAFIMQPLVENAIGHGMKSEEPLHIRITTQVVDGVLQILVSDDGIGMDTSEKAHMFDANREHSGIALRNVDERLRGYFGINAGLSVQSELGNGTTVILTLGLLEHLKRKDKEEEEEL